MTGMRSRVAFVGTFTGGESGGVHGYRIDREDGSFDDLGATEAGENPTFLAVHPSGEYLYAANKVDDGAITAFSVDGETGALSRLNRRPSGDAGPCYCAVEATGRYLLTAHYNGGSAAMHPIESDGRIGEAADVVGHEGSSVHPERQTRSYVHSIVPGPDNRFAYAQDLGADRIVAYEMDLDAGQLRPSEAASVETHPGAGPRHLDFRPNGRVAYVANELDSTLSAFERDPETGALSELAVESTLPEDFEGENYPADVHVHPTGNWLYASNRGQDAIAVFELDERGRPELIDCEPTRGERPRNFALDPAGEFLFAENKDSGDVFSFRVGDDGLLSATGHVAEVSRPSCLVFLPTA